MDRRARAYAIARRFYAGHLGWLGLLVSIVVIAYGGGAVMFWFHSIYLGEGGPAISPWLHWLVDSTAGAIGLGPVIAVLLPLGAWAATTPSTTGGTGTGEIRPIQFSFVAGGLLALATAPAPILHDRLIGRGTWLAEQLTRLLGNGHSPTGESQEVPLLAEMGQQVGASLPTYTALMWLVLMTLQVLNRRSLSVGNEDIELPSRPM
jgi:hypothetical protein